MFFTYESLKSHIDYRMEDVRKSARLCKNKPKKKKEKIWKTSAVRLKGGAR
ncbi:hypothetical protein GCM10008931_09180 [Oceanobacillus oncorhynchi subsp. oncorhynchi]